MNVFGIVWIIATLICLGCGWVIAIDETKDGRDVVFSKVLYWVFASIIPIVNIILVLLCICAFLETDAPKIVVFKARK